MSIDAKKVSVIGSGISGIAVARYFVSRGSTVFLSDSAPEEVVVSRLKKANLLNDVSYEAGGNSNRVYECDLAVVCPGVPMDSPVSLGLDEAGIPVIGEMELGFQLAECCFLALTGSAGKSTTVSLLERVLTGDHRAKLCGNIGYPVVDVVQELTKEDMAICEVSTFQMERIDTFAPDIAVLLNLAPNHLDRHSSIEEYYGLKLDMARAVKRGGDVILNANQAEFIELASSLDERKITFFGKKISGYRSSVLENGTIVIYSEDGVRTEYASIDTFELPGDHNLENLLAVAAVASLKGVSGFAFEERLVGFSGLSHRMEKVRALNGVTYYNDSKATTAEALYSALSGFGEKSVLLIAGGKDKGANLESVKTRIAAKCKALFLIGEAALRMKNEWDGTTDIHLCGSINEAVEAAFENAKPGDVVLLSPACSSFDMFKNYIERGNEFKRVVGELV